MLLCNSSQFREESMFTCWSDKNARIVFLLAMFTIIILLLALDPEAHTNHTTNTPAPTSPSHNPPLPPLPPPPVSFLQHSLHSGVPPSPSHANHPPNPLPFHDPITMPLKGMSGSFLCLSFGGRHAGILHGQANADHHSTGFGPSRNDGVGQTCR